MPYIELGKTGTQLGSSKFIGADRITGGVIAAQEIIIGGGLQGIIRSENYDPTNETGWAVFGDGSASFYGTITIGDNAVITGDLYSSNWDGSIPANLATVDTGASAGYYLDSSVGSGQFEGNLFLGGDLDMQSGGNIKVRDAGGTEVMNIAFATTEGFGSAHIDGDVVLANPHFIRGYGFSETLVAEGDWDLSYFWLGHNSSIAEDAGGLFWYVNTYLNPMTTDTEYGIYLEKDGNILPGLVVGIEGTPVAKFYGNSFGVVGTGGATTAALHKIGDEDTGLNWPTANQLDITAGNVDMLKIVNGGSADQIMIGVSGTIANPALVWDSDQDMGYYYITAGKQGWAAGGTKYLELSSEWKLTVTTGTLQAATDPNPVWTENELKWIRSGNMVHCWYTFIWGSGGADPDGSGTYYVWPPDDGAPDIAAGWGTASSDRVVMGTWQADDDDSTFHDYGGVRFEPDGTPPKFVMFRDGTTGHVAHNNPHAWENGDILYIQVSYPTDP